MPGSMMKGCQEQKIMINPIPERFPHPPKRKKKAGFLKQITKAGLPRTYLIHVNKWTIDRWLYLYLFFKASTQALSLLAYFKLQLVFESLKLSL